MSTDMNSTVEPTEQQIAANERFLCWWDGYLNALIAISLFGGQITFTVIISEIANPAELDLTTDISSQKRARFGKETVRMFVALSWLLFMVPGIAVVAKMVLSDPGIRDYVRVNLGARRKWLVVPIILSFVLNGLPVLAVLFLALAVAAYVPVVGWIGVGLISLFTLIVLILWLVFDA